VTAKVSTVGLRQRIGDMIDRVALQQDEFVIERKGKPLAALVSIQRLEQMRRYAKRQALEFLRRPRRRALSDRSAMELAIEAQQWAREQAPRRRRKTT
jgi:antitoxin (DNA-binding transcriptional repressor) of toxin-antitoxin stability system